MSKPLSNNGKAILVLGGKGMLGQAVVGAGRDRGVSMTPLGHAELDLADTRAVAEVIDRDCESATAVINCAALTAVDDCEEKVDLAMEVNGRAVGRLAQLCLERSLPLVHVSSDYVFSGDGIADSAGAVRGYREDDPVGPVSIYGRSKELGERLALEGGAAVVRASWLFGPGGPNFVATMLRLGSSGQQLKVVHDQVGCPTYTPDLAVALLEVASRMSGHGGEPRQERLFHFANPPAVSWFEFARQIFDTFELSVDVVPCTTEEFPRPAPRPAYSVLDTERFEQVFSYQPRSWRDCLNDYRVALDQDKLNRETSD